MNYFLAVNDRQLGTCLRMLFAEKLQPAVQTVRKIFQISGEKNLSATNADAQIIRNARKRFVKPGNTTNRKNNNSFKS